MKERTTTVALDELEGTAAVNLLVTQMLAFCRSAPPAVPTTAAALRELDRVAEDLLAGGALTSPSFGAEVIEGAVCAPDEPYDQVVGVGYLDAIGSALALQQLHKRAAVDVVAFLPELHLVQVASDEWCPPWQGLISSDLDGIYSVTPKGVAALGLSGRIEVPRLKPLTIAKVAHPSPARRPRLAATLSRRARG